MFEAVVTKNTNSEKVSWDNLKEVIKTRNINLVVSASEGWFKENPGMKNTDLEKKLREENLELYLIADKKPPDDLQTVTNYTPEFEKCPYMLVFCCRPKEPALKELKMHSDSYEENFKNLDQAGTLIQKSETLPKKSDFKKKDFEQETLLEKLQHNEIKIKYNKIEKEDYEKQFLKDMHTFKEQYKVEATEKLFGMAPDGSGVWAMTHGNMIISKVGFMIGFNKEQVQQLKYVNLQDKTEWTGFIEK